MIASNGYIQDINGHDLFTPLSLRCEICISNMGNLGLNSSQVVVYSLL
jgi:hypothetical protein